MSIEGNLMSAVEVLGRALLEIAEQGQATPCQGRRRDRWTSDDATDREWAASVCLTLACRVLEQCAALADERDERHHVWGGVDRTPPPATRRKSANTTKADRIAMTTMAIAIAMYSTRSIAMYSTSTTRTGTPGMTLLTRIRSRLSDHLLHHPAGDHPLATTRWRPSGCPLLAIPLPDPLPTRPVAARPPTRERMKARRRAATPTRSIWFLRSGATDDPAVPFCDRRGGVYRPDHAPHRNEHKEHNYGRS